MTEEKATEAPRGYRARFRFRVSKKLNIDDNEITVRIGERSVTLSASAADKPIKGSDWLIANARGFETEETARQFGHDLRAACAVASAANRLGIDGGVDLATSGLGSALKEHLKETTGAVVRDNVHGVDVFLDDPSVRIFSVQATGSVLRNPQPFLEDVSDFLGQASALSQRVQDILLLLNYALMRPEPVAQIVFIISAVEMLGQTEKWSGAQKTQIKELIAVAKASRSCSDLERDEIATALRNGLHKLSLRQGVLRLLNSLGLSQLKDEWDALYGERSTLVHGLAPKPGVDYSPLAFKAVSLCGRILMAAVAQEVPGADRHVDRMYPLGT
ncbi:MAG TPA: hypothetical protein PK271_04835 [Hyphomicrobium sp.]|uniref:hypothetical protein n=1 Tax=Hyphomicrobium sp. TaxID=82 RepID=UPI002B8DAA0F|nr:hypothetical protein [Hyphomicrobium sp.]HRN87907.1 hypothetical protein [Hyphomicrobium sp.]